MSCSRILPCRLYQTEVERWPQVYIKPPSSPTVTVYDASQVFYLIFSPTGNKRKKQVKLSPHGERLSQKQGWRSHSTYGKRIEDGHPQRSRLILCFLEDQCHQDSYLTSLITSFSPWGHYSFENGHHFHGKLPQHEGRDKDLPLLLLYGASWQLCSGWGNVWRSQMDAKKPTKAKQLCSAAASVSLNYIMDAMQFTTPIFQILCLVLQCGIVTIHK